MNGSLILGVHATGLPPGSAQIEHHRLRGSGQLLDLGGRPGLGGTSRDAGQRGTDEEFENGLLLSCYGVCWWIWAIVDLKFGSLTEDSAG